MPECDVVSENNNRDIPYNQTWLNHAIPLKNEKFEKCLRFAPQNAATGEPGKCSADMFDMTKRIECREFVYASDERNVQTEVCQRF